MENQRTVFVKGLAKGATERHLHAVFGPFGTIADCQVARHRSGRSAGFAIVTYLRTEEAAVAMQHLDNMIFLGRRISVKWFEAGRVLDLQGASLPSAALGTLGAAEILALAQLLEQPASVQPMLPPQQPAWPSMVANWLNDFVPTPTAQDMRLAPALDDAAQDGSPATCVVTANRLRNDFDAASAGPANKSLTSGTAETLDLARLTLAAGLATGGGVSPTFAAASQATTAPTTPSCTAVEASGPSSSSPLAPSDPSFARCSTLTDDACSDSASVHLGSDVDSSVVAGSSSYATSFVSTVRGAGSATDGGKLAAARSSAPGGKLEGADDDDEDAKNRFADFMAGLGAVRTRSAMGAHPQALQAHIGADGPGSSRSATASSDPGARARALANIQQMRATGCFAIGPHAQQNQAAALLARQAQALPQDVMPLAQPVQVAQMAAFGLPPEMMRAMQLHAVLNAQASVAAVQQKQYTDMMAAQLAYARNQQALVAAAAAMHAQPGHAAAPGMSPGMPYMSAVPAAGAVPDLNTWMMLNAAGIRL